MSFSRIFLTLILATFSTDDNFVLSVEQFEHKIFPGIERVSSGVSVEGKTLFETDKRNPLQEGTPESLRDRELIKTENSSPDLKSLTARLEEANKVVDNKLPVILVNEKYKVYSGSRGSSLDIVANIIKQIRDKPPTSTLDYPNRSNNINEVNLKDTALKLHEIFRERTNETVISNEEGRSHSINIASYIDKLLTQLGRNELLKVSTEVANPAKKDSSGDQESSGIGNPKEREQPFTLTTSQADSSTNVKLNVDNLNIEDQLSEHDADVENVIDKLMEIINQYKQSNTTSHPNDTDQRAINSSSITNALLKNLNKIFQTDKNYESNVHQPLLVPVLKRPVNKVNITSEPPLAKLQSKKDSRTELLPDDLNEDINVKDTVFTYILDKLRERLSQRSSAAPKPEETSSTRSIVTNKNGKTTIYIYPQTKVKTNQTANELKLDNTANTNAELPPFYTILNGQVIGSINLNSILKANGLKREPLTKAVSSSVVSDRVLHDKATTVEEPRAKPEYKQPVNVAYKNIILRTTGQIKNENVNGVSKNEKINNIKDFIGFLKAIQEKLDSSKPKYELKSGGFDLSSLKVINNSSQRNELTLKNAQLISGVRDPGSLVKLDTSEANRQHMESSESSGDKDHQFSGLLGEDTYEDYSTESEEPLDSKYSNIDVGSSSGPDDINGTSVLTANDGFNKRSEDFSGILESISRRISVRPRGELQKKNKRRKNKVKIRQTADFSTSNCQCGWSVNTRIVGGQDSTISKHPWIAQLVTRNGKPFCGGTLINDRFVLTAAHCLKGRNAEDLLVKMGASTSNEGTSFLVKSLIPHEKYSPSKVTLYDIALVEIEEPLYKYTSVIKPICLPTSEGRSQDMRKGIIAGFGSLSEDGPQSDTLQEARVIIMEPSTCEYSYKYSHDQLNPLILCAKEKNVDSCQGDSGGPLIRKIGNSLVQLGVTSWGIGCARDEYPGIYTKVSSYLSWIKSVTNEAIYCQQSASYHRQVVRPPNINNSDAEEDYRIMNEFIKNIARQLRSKDKFILSEDEVNEASEFVPDSQKHFTQEDEGDEASEFVPDSQKHLTQEDTFELIHG